MRDRPTPETDAVKFRIGETDHYAVHVIYARRLERERAEAFLKTLNLWKD